MNPSQPYHDLYGDLNRHPNLLSPNINDAELVTEVEVVRDANSGETKVDSRNNVAIRKQSIFERMLSPQSLQIIMSAGGAILAIGFAIWLWTMGAFENPIFASVAMGAANLGVLSLGVHMVTRTRYSLAGRGLAFLSAMLLPLHLWFYNAQDLIVVSEGGHLWIPALMICGLYALVARLTRDSVFVYQLVGGIVLTGLLFLAGPQMGFLWPVIPTCLFLVVLGTIAIHVDRFFVESEGAFSREQFGKAFFRAGHLTVLAGLGYLLLGQLAQALLGWLWSFETLAIGSNPEINFWSLPILATAAWAYAFSHISRGNDGRFLFAASCIVIWSVLTALHVFSIALTPNLILLMIAISMLLGQIGMKVFAKKMESDFDPQCGDENQEGDIAISIGNSVLAAVAFGQAIFCLLSDNLAGCTPVFLAQGFVTALSLLARTELALGERNKFMSNLRLILGASLVSVFGVLGLTLFAGSSLLHAVAIMTGVVAITAVASQILNFGQGQRIAASITTGGVTGILIAFGTALTTGAIEFGTVPALGIVLVVAACLLQVGLVTGRREAMVASILVFALGLAQAAVILQITSAYSIIVAISAIGAVLLLAARAYEQLKKATDSSSEMNSLSLGTQIGNVAVAAGSIASILFVAPKLMMNNNEIRDFWLLLFQILPLGLAYTLNRLRPWKTTFVSLGIATAVMVAITFAMASTVPMVHRIELIVLAIGVATLAAGHLGWFREQEALEGANSSYSRAVVKERFVSVSANLVLGSILISLPMIIGILAFRFFEFQTSSFWNSFHEIGALSLGLLLLGSGILCKIRSTTIAGFATLSAFVASLVVLIRIPEALQSVSVTMMIGGGLFFAIGILLSMYREWILGLPAKIKEGEGVFKVLKWR